ncbi:hypothetical protein U9M48_007942 [Paspalum notatum var. saurae]|uniref:Pectin acetylesterase n=1 Tax=Paspalum notatum var. saurae TaxID=547442 RepID=A0AAQ3WCK9_PASNO
MREITMSILSRSNISGNNTIRQFFSSLVSLQGVQKNLNIDCLNSTDYPYLCFFPQYALPNIRAPFFILNSAYDVYQFHHIFVPPSSDPRGQWSRCKSDPGACSTSQIATLQDLRSAMLTSLKQFESEREAGMFINSCFAHCQSELQDTWFAPNSPSIHNKKIAEVVGDWYFERSAAKEIDCAYPCDSTCRNLIPSDQMSPKFQLSPSCTFGSYTILCKVELKVPYITFLPRMESQAPEEDPDLVALTFSLK